MIVQTHPKHSMSEKSQPDEVEKPSTTVPATVQKVIPSLHPNQPEKAEIVLHEGDPLYREIRIENKLKNETGEEVGLKPGADVDFIVEADAKDTVRK